LSFNQFRDFNNCLASCSLTDIRSSRGLWTWKNKVVGSRRITGRLDTVVCNENWLDTLPGSFYQYIHHSSSDHSPMLLHLIPPPNSGPRTFGDFNYWASVEGFHQLVQTVWDTQVTSHHQINIKLF